MITVDLKKKYFAPVSFIDFAVHGTPDGILTCLQNLYAAQKYYRNEYDLCGRELGLFYARECTFFKISSIFRWIEKECDK